MNTTQRDGSSGEWIDRLVELHVLAEHGDTAALAEAECWMARDARARTAWDTVIRDCSGLSLQRSGT